MLYDQVEDEKWRRMGGVVGVTRVPIVEEEKVVY